MAKNRGAANLVGLAALGALGYKMLQDKKGSSAPVEDRGGSAVARPSEDSGMGVDEYARDNSESAMYEKEPGGESKVAPPKAAAPKAAPKTAPKTAPNATAPTINLRDREAGMSRGTRPDYREPPNVDIEAGMSRGTRNIRDTGDEGDRLLARYPAPKPEPTFFSEKGLTPMAPYVMAPAKRYKQGGAVKAKKMASGGVTRSSASKRADGIATKGKTRGKMY